MRKMYDSTTKRKTINPERRHFAHGTRYGYEMSCRCSDCVTADRTYKRDYYKRRADQDPNFVVAHRRRARRNQLKNDYGLTVEQADEMVEKQFGLCAICGHPPGWGKPLMVDHDHSTGLVRGLLCSGCNVGIAMLGENSDRLLSAASYLKGHGK